MSNKYGAVFLLWHSGKLLRATTGHSSCYVCFLPDAQRHGHKNGKMLNSHLCFTHFGQNRSHFLLSGVTICAVSSPGTRVAETAVGVRQLRMRLTGRHAHRCYRPLDGHASDCSNLKMQGPWSRETFSFIESSVRTVHHQP